MVIQDFKCGELAKMLFILLYQPGPGTESIRYPDKLRANTVPHLVEVRGIWQCGPELTSHSVCIEEKGDF
jgi:hypothetical protein